MAKIVLSKLLQDKDYRRVASANFQGRHTGLNRQDHGLTLILQNALAVLWWS